MDCLVSPEAEPPSMPGTADRVLAMAHVGPAPRVAVIGRHILPYLLALMACGCTVVRTLRPDGAAPDVEPVDLAWIVNVDSEHELDGALRAAHRRSRVVVLEGGACRHCRELRQHAVQAGLEVVSFDHVAQRVLLAAPAGLAPAA
jgi:hypothetical protein